MKAGGGRRAGTWLPSSAREAGGQARGGRAPLQAVKVRFTRTNRVGTALERGAPRRGVPQLVKRGFDKLGGRGSSAPPPGAAPQIFNLSRGSFALRAKPQNPADSAPPATPLHNLLELSSGKLWAQIVQGSDFCSGKWDFPTQKSAPAPDAHVAGLDFDARGLRPSRALPGLDRRDVFLSGDDFCEGAWLSFISPGTANESASRRSSFPGGRLCLGESSVWGWDQARSSAP